MKAEKKIIKERFLIMEDIGQGGYGTVSKAIDKLTNDLVAIKFVRLLIIDEIYLFQNKRMKNFKSEYQLIETLGKFKFPGTEL